MLRVLARIEFVVGVIGLGLWRDQLGTAFVVLVVGIVGEFLATRTRLELRRRVGAAASDPGRNIGPLTFLITAFALGVQSQLLGALALVALLAWTIITPRHALRQRLRPEQALPALALLIVLMLVYGQRLTDPRVVGSAAISGLAIIVVFASVSRLTATAALVQLGEGLAVYLIVSVLLYGAGVRSPGEGLRIGLASTNGVFSVRLLFPLARSYVTAPAIAAGYLAALPGLSLVQGTRRRTVRAVGAIAAVFVLLAGDYRSALVFGPLIGVSLLLRPRFTLRLVPTAVAFLFVLPFWYPVVAAPANSMAQFVQSQISALNRGGETSTALSGRDVIWERSRQTFSGETTSSKLIGYGADGHITSGASASYASVVRQTLTSDAAEAAPPHNSGLQTLFDAGIVGVAAMIATLWVVLTRLGRRFEHGEVAALMGIGMLATFGTIAGTEVVLAPTGHLPEPFLCLVVLVAIVIRSPQLPRSDADPAFVGGALQGSSA